MKALRSLHVLIAIAAIAAVPAVAFAQSTGPETTPVPMGAKPDWSSTNFLVGTWSCSNKSSRRPSAFPSTVTYAMDPGGYWMNVTTEQPATSWFPQATTTNEKVTYDSTTKRWIDVGYDNIGNYIFNTSPGWTGSTISWHDNTFVATPDIASASDTVVTKNSDTKTTASSGFVEGNGRKVNFVVSCSKK